MAASLADVVDALTMDDQCRTYYDRQTEEVTWVFEDELAAAEDLAEDADLDEAASLTTSGEKALLELALLIVEDTADRFVPLPTQWDVHEHPR